jgi:hypothetical protein
MMRPLNIWELRSCFTRCEPIRYHPDIQALGIFVEEPFYIEIITEMSIVKSGKPEKIYSVGITCSKKVCSCKTLPHRELVDQYGVGVHTDLSTFVSWPWSSRNPTQLVLPNKNDVKIFGRSTYTTTSSRKAVIFLSAGLKDFGETK